MMLSVAAVSVVLSSLPFAAAGSSLLGGWSAVKGAAKIHEVIKLASFANAHNKKEVPKVRVGGGEVRVGGGEVSVGGGEVRVGGGEVRVGGGEVRVGGGEVRVGGGEMRVGGGEVRVGGGEGTGLKLVSVESAKSQVVAGVNWSITLKAAAVAPVARRLGHRRASPPATTTYVAEVFQSLTPVVGEPTVAAQRAGAAQPVGNGQAAVGNGQPVVSNERPVADVQQSGVAKPVLAREPVLADYLVLVSFAKKS
ncbi:unnamed protein product [Closterium sp. Naga37s-1]|nr:unnamed protein product [Closterium sp. Naga37s-1]